VNASITTQRITYENSLAMNQGQYVINQHNKKFFLLSKHEKSTKFESSEQIQRNPMAASKF